MPTFTTSFLPPDPVTGLEIEADLDTSAIRLSWDQTLIPEVDFRGYRIYRSLDNGVTFTLLALQDGVAEVTFADFEAPLNTPLIYRVTQSNPDFESDPADASIELSDLRWWIVRPGDETLTFPVPKVRGAPITSPKVMEAFSPMGRPGKLVVSDVVQNEDGQLTFLVMPDNPGMVALMRAIQSFMEGALIVKAPDGSIFHAQFGTMTRAFTNVPGMQEVTIPFVGVT